MADNITLNPCQSLALRRLVDTLKADDSLFDTCPAAVRSALCDILMPPYSTAETEIEALKAANADSLRLLERFAEKIKRLENRR